MYDNINSPAYQLQQCMLLSLILSVYRAAVWMGYYQLFPDIIRYFPKLILGGKNVCKQLHIPWRYKNIETVVTKHLHNQVTLTGNQYCKSSITNMLAKMRRIFSCCHTKVHTFATRKYHCLKANDVSRSRSIQSIIYGNNVRNGNSCSHLRWFNLQLYSQQLQLQTVATYLM